MKKNAVSQLNVIISGGVYKQKPTMSKPRFTHKPDKFPWFGGIGYIYIERESLIQHWQVYVAFPHLGIGMDWESLEHRLLVECIRYQYEAHSL